MSIKLKRETSIVLDAEDMHAILSSELCDYGSFSGLEVRCISTNDADETFLITMMPKPAPEAEPKP